MCLVPMAAPKEQAYNYQYDFQVCLRYLIRNMGRARKTGRDPDCRSPTCLRTRLLAIPPRHSPGWHRRARLARSKARRRVRCAALEGIPAAFRDLHLLEAHHSAPIYTSVIRPSAMGWDKQKDKQRAKPGSGYWDYWRGTQQQWGKDK